jgi:hypothetical protein
MSLPGDKDIEKGEKSGQNSGITGRIICKTEQQAR